MLLFFSPQEADKNYHTYLSLRLHLLGAVAIRSRVPAERETTTPCAFGVVLTTLGPEMTIDSREYAKAKKKHQAD